MPRCALLALVLLVGCQRSAQPGPSPPRPSSVPSTSAPLSTTGAGGTTSSPTPSATSNWAPPKAQLKPEPSVCTKGVVKECEFWRAAMRQVLKLDPPCMEAESFAYSWGADGDLHRSKILHPAAVACDVDPRGEVAVRCFFPRRKPDERASVRAKALAASFNACVSEEFGTTMRASGTDDADVFIDLEVGPAEFSGLRVIWRNQYDKGTRTDQVQFVGPLPKKP